MSDEFPDAVPVDPAGEPVAGRLQLDLVGLAEAAELVGIGRAALAERRLRHPNFPLPVAELRCGPIWLRAQIEEYRLTEERLGRRGWYRRHGEQEALNASGDR